MRNRRPGPPRRSAAGRAATLLPRGHPEDATIRAVREGVSRSNKVPEQYPTRIRACASSTASSINRVGSFIGPIVSGALLRLAFGVQALLLLSAILLIIGLIVVS